MVLMLKRYRLDIYSPGIVDRVRVNKEIIVIQKETCEILQKIGKIEEIQVVDGERIRIVILRAMIGSG